MELCNTYFKIISHILVGFHDTHTKSVDSVIYICISFKIPVDNELNLARF